MGENLGKLFAKISCLQKTRLICFNFCLSSGFDLKITRLIQTS